MAKKSKKKKIKKNVKEDSEESKKLIKKDKKLVKSLQDVFEDFLLSVCRVEFTKKPGKKEDLEVPETEQEVIAVVNDLVSDKAKKLLKNYKGKKARILPLSGLWQSCYDRKYELLRALVTSEVLFDKGLIKGLAAAEQLKMLSLNKLKRYIVSVILFGSVARGTMHEKSDVDIAFVIDDTDVKKMSRKEVLARLRTMIYGFAAQVGFEFNIQVYLLTDFWKGIRDVHPVFFSMLRDGVPLFDMGMFTPWRLLLKMGKLKPSPEAVKQFHSSGRMLLDDIKKKIKELVVERVFLSMFNPAQAAMMMVGIAPTHHGETPELFKKTFVDEEKMVDKKYYKYLKKIYDIHKGVEYGNIEEVTPEMLAEQMEHAEDFLKMTEDLFDKIRKDQIKEKIDKIEASCMTTIVETLESLDVKKVSKKNALEKFKEKLVDTGLISGDKYYFVSKKLERLKRDYERGLLTTEEIAKAEREVKNVISSLESLTKINKLRETDRAKIHFRHDDKNGEVWVLGDVVFIIKDLKHPERTIHKAKLENDGSFESTIMSSLDDLTKTREKMAGQVAAEVKNKTLESISDFIGEEVEFVFM